MIDKKKLVKKRKKRKLVQKAAQHPDRPGEKCKSEPGALVPVVNQGLCEGKTNCAVVCPYDVFEIRRFDENDFKSLPWRERLKLRIHGLKTAYTPRKDQCRACGLCVVACPESAITLVKLNEV